MPDAEDMIGAGFRESEMSRDQEIWAALDSVRDPELDEPITDLAFVSEVRIGEATDVLVRLRLPTYFCAPNFAYLMVADAHDAVSRLPWVRSATVRLEDHFASEEINGGVADDAGFSGSFPGQAGGELDELRAIFQRKAHTACLERACRKLVQAGWEIEGLSQASLADLPEGSERESLLRRRSDIGLSLDASARLVVGPDGEAVDDVARYLRYAKAVRVSIDGNGIFCRGLLDTRYGTAGRPGTLSGVLNLIPVTEVRRAS